MRDHTRIPTQRAHGIVCSLLSTHFSNCIGEAEDDGGEGSAEVGHDVYRRAHLVLYRVVQVVPACPSTLLELLKVYAACKLCAAALGVPFVAPHNS